MLTFQVTRKSVNKNGAQKMNLTVWFLLTYDSAINSATVEYSFGKKNSGAYSMTPFAQVDRKKYSVDGKILVGSFVIETTENFDSSDYYKVGIKCIINGSINPASPDTAFYKEVGGINTTVVSLTRDSEYTDPKALITAPVSIQPTDWGNFSVDGSNRKSLVVYGPATIQHLDTGKIKCSTVDSDSITVDGNITVNKVVDAGTGNTTYTGSIDADGDITAGKSITAGHGVTAGGNIVANANNTTGEDGDITAAGIIRADGAAIGSGRGVPGSGDLFAGRIISDGNILSNGGNIYVNKINNNGGNITAYGDIIADGDVLLKSTASNEYHHLRTILNAIIYAINNNTTVGITNI